MWPTDRTKRLHLELVIHVIVSETEGLPVRARLSYESADPLAVRLDFRDSPADAPPWFLSRDLLFAGLRAPAGEGSVRVWPPCACHGSETVRIALRGNGGAAVLYVPAAEFGAWLKETFTAVPAGTESDHLGLDDILERVLRSG
ncbi:SsgA family sporulation/cell division regulator [Streptomyces sp. NPDC050534]|uniref:SsgA family sporulation/cell division regulator n=1 Tax=Streptomyces sp. NPDC050534 TaxID=3365625 RepID=UPI0037AC88E1